MMSAWPSATTGGIITSSPAVTAANSPSGVATAANALRGIEFVGAGIPQLVNFGNVTLGALSNGGSLTAARRRAPLETRRHSQQHATPSSALAATS